MKLILLFLISCFKNVDCFSFGSKDVPYIIDSIEGPRKNEITPKLQCSAKNIDKASAHIEIQYYIKEHISIPTIHVKYTININGNPHQYFLNIKTKNKTLPWNVNSSFIKDLSFHLKKDIQAKLHILKKKEKKLNIQNNSKNIADKNNKSKG